MDKSYLNEAFKQLEILEEEDFRLDDDGIDDMKSFVDTDEKNEFVDIIDPEAETEEELEDSYIGKVILECSVCKSKLYKEAEEVELDEEEGMANVGEECPFCYSSDGYKVIGEVAPYTGEPEVKVEVEPKEEEEHKNESLKEGAKWDINQDLASEWYEAFDEYYDGSFVVDPDGENEEEFDTFEEAVEYAKELGLKTIKVYPFEYEDADGEVYEFYGAMLNLNGEIDEYLNESKNEGLLGALAGAAVGGALGHPIVGAVGGSALQNLANSKDEELEESEDSECCKGHFHKGAGKKLCKGKDCSTKNEAFEKIELETDTEKIKIESEPKEVGFDGGEMIAPLDMETEQEFKKEDELAPEEPVGEEQYHDEDVEDFGEEEFNNIGESYLKRVYENVESFKTSKVSTKKNNLTVEGVIKFSSGKEKKTQFVFEAKDITKDGKARFIGENKQISRGRKSFTLKGTLKESKFIAESLTYNYRAKGADGKSQRIYGTAKAK